MPSSVQPISGLQLIPGPSLVLASASTTRAALLREHGLEIDIVRPVLDEESLRETFRAEQVSSEDSAVALADLKAQRGSAMTATSGIVLGADQLLEIEERWLGKPRSRAEAEEQLRQLSGKRHRLVTAAVAYRDGSRVWHAVDTAELWVRPLSDAFIETYLDVAGDAVMSSVGCYRIEGLGLHLMSRIRGDHATILGLPMLPLLAFLRDQKVLAT